MIKRRCFALMTVCAIAGFFAGVSRAQLYTLTKEQLIELTSQNKFDRFADGRPKVPDALLERARAMSAEEVWAGLNQAAGAGGGRGGQAYRNQYEDGFQVLHPNLKMVEPRIHGAIPMPAASIWIPFVNGEVRAKANGLGDQAG